MCYLNILVFIVISPSLLFADVEKSIKINIGKMRDVQQGSKFELPVFLSNHSYPISSFDFLITFDTNVFSFETVIPTTHSANGPCIWDRFDLYDCTKKNPDSLCPRGTIRINANIKGHNLEPPNCLTGANDLEIFRLKFLVTNDRTYEGRTYPVHFVWNECSDNTIQINSPPKHSKSNILHVDSVFFEDGLLLRQIELPSTAYFQESCLIHNDIQLQNRAIDFHHGYINLCCYHMADDRGDINLNGLSNELSDFLLFQDYFLYGISIFTVNPAGQIAGTDLNYDGKTVALEDLVCLDAIVKGDAKPFKKSPPVFEGTLLDDSVNHRVHLKSDSTVYAVWLQLNGEVVPLTRIKSEVFRSNHVDSVTNVLFLGIDSTYSDTMPLLQFSEPTKILDAQAATRDGYKVLLSIKR
jgi:hypothetical protein